MRRLARGLCALTLSLTLAHGTRAWGQPRGVPAAPLDERPSVAVGSIHACALDRQGAVWCWGQSEGYALGDGTLATRLRPAVVPGLEGGVVQLGVGYAFGCALRDTGELWCWGDAGRARVPGADPALRGRAFPVTSLGRDVVLVRVDGTHVIALLRDGSLRIMGPENLSLTYRSDLPPGMPLVDVTLGTFNACALRADGVLSCWGDSTWGGLGPGPEIDPTDQSFDRNHHAVVVARDAAGRPLPVRSLASAGAARCALLEDRSVWCWGSNGHNHLGRGDYAVRSDENPAPVVGLPPDLERLESGDAGICAITTGGDAWCWGRNDFGQMGNGDLTPFEGRLPGSDRLHYLGTTPRPLRLGGARVASVSSTSDRLCAWYGSDRVRCYGLPFGMRYRRMTRVPPPSNYVFPTR